MVKIILCSTVSNDFLRSMKTPMVNFPLAIPFVIISTNSIIAMEVTIFSETILPQVQQIIGVKTIHQPIIVLTGDEFTFFSHVSVTAITSNVKSIDGKTLFKLIKLADIRVALK